MMRFCLIAGMLILPSIGLSQSPIDSTESAITLRTFVEDEVVPLNREVIFHVQLEWIGDLSKYRIHEVPEPQVTNLSMRGSGSSNKVNTAPDGTTYSTKRRTFYFRPMEIGMSYIEGVKIKYEDTILKHEEFLISERIGIKIIEPLPEPGDTKISSFILILLVGLIILISAILFYFRYHKRKKEEQAKILLSQDKQTLEEKYIRLLKETIHFNTDNIKDSLSDLSHLLNGYFSERYNIMITNISKENVLEILKEKGISEDNIERIESFYKTADLVKFAGEVVNDSEFHRLYDTVELVLDEQKKLFPKGEDQ